LVCWRKECAAEQSYPITQGYELLHCGAVYADPTVYVYTTLCNDRIDTYSALPFLSRNLHRNIRFRRLQMSLGGMAVVRYR